MKDVRRLVVKGRLPASAVGLLGVLLAVPLLVLPTHAIVWVPGPGEQSGVVDFEQSFWSWGRFAATAPGADEGRFDVSNIVGLVLFVLALVAGIAGALAHAFRPGADGRVLGAAGLAWAASEVVGALGRRVGDGISGLYENAGGLVLATKPAGGLQMASAALLVVALGLVVWRPVVGLVRSVAARAAAPARRDAAAEAVVPEPAGRPKPRVGIATIRDVEPGARPSAGRRASEPRSGVGFSDDPGATSDRERFRPPR